MENIFIIEPILDKGVDEEYAVNEIKQDLARRITKHNKT